MGHPVHIYLLFWYQHCHRTEDKGWISINLYISSLVQAASFRSNLEGTVSVILKWPSMHACKESNARLTTIPWTPLCLSNTEICVCKLIETCFRNALYGVQTCSTLEDYINCTFRGGGAFLEIIHRKKVSLLWNES